MVKKDFKVKYMTVARRKKILQECLGISSEEEYQLYKQQLNTPIKNYMGMDNPVQEFLNDMIVKKGCISYWDLYSTCPNFLFIPICNFLKIDPQTAINKGRVGDGAIIYGAKYD